MRFLCFTRKRQEIIYLFPDKNNESTESNKPVIPIMNNTNLVHFDNDGVEIYIDTITGESFATVSGYARMSGKPKSTIQSRIDRMTEGERINKTKETEIFIGGGLQGVRLIYGKTVTRWLAKDNPDLLAVIAELGWNVYAHKLAGFKVKSTAIESRQVKPNEKLPLDDLKDLAWLLKTHGNTKIKQKTLIEILKFHHPTEPINVLMQWYKDILFDKSELKLPEKEIPLNATHLAIELDLFHPLSGLPNPQAANRLLERLGYQYRDAGRWRATKQGLRYLAEGMRTSHQLFWDKSILYTLRENPLRYQATEALFDYELPFSF